MGGRLLNCDKPPQIRVYDRKPSKRFETRPERMTYDNINEEYITHTNAIKLLNKFYEENEELKEELMKFKKWEKYVGDVKREDLDRVFKMSIYEIAETFEYYKERIEKLEKEVRE